MLKTTINLTTMGKPGPAAGIFDTAGIVAKRYVQIAYGLSQFDLDEGLSWVVQLGDQIPNRELGTIAFAPWTRKSDGRWSQHSSPTTATTSGWQCAELLPSSTRSVCERSTRTTSLYRSTSPGPGRSRHR